MHDLPACLPDLAVLLSALSIIWDKWKGFHSANRKPRQPVCTASRLNPQSTHAQTRVFVQISAPKFQLPKASIGAMSAGFDRTRRGAPFSRVLAHISAPQAPIGAISAGFESARRGAPSGHVKFAIREQIRNPPIRNPRKPCLFGPRTPDTLPLQRLACQASGLELITPHFGHACLPSGPECAAFVLKAVICSAIWGSVNRHEVDPR